MDTHTSGSSLARSDVGAHSPDLTVKTSKPFASYPGGKDAAGSCERIIRAFAPHALYVEMFLGGGAVMRRKRPALWSIGIDHDESVIERWEAVQWPGLDLLCCSGIEWLAGAKAWLPDDALIYVDPPYPHSTRSRKRLYDFELTDQDHARLLDELTDPDLTCSIVISSYDNPLYRERLAGWDHDEWQAMTRGGVRTEHLWSRRSTTARFGEEARYVGKNFRERERLKRKAARWVGKLKKMPPAERSVVLAALIAEYSDAAGVSVDAAGIAGSDGGILFRDPASSLPASTDAPAAA